jgi:hypothetical protein
VQLLPDPVNRSERVRTRISQQVCKMDGIGVDYRGPRWLGELLVSLNGFSRVNGICIPQLEIHKRRTNDQRHGSRKRNKTLNEKKCRNKNGEQVTGKGMGGGRGRGGGGGRQSEGKTHPTENSLGPEYARTAKNLQNPPTEFPQLPTTSFPFALGTVFLLGKQ